jgi:hypothetical protein
MTRKSQHLLGYVLTIGASVLAVGCRKSGEVAVDSAAVRSTTHIASTDTTADDRLLNNYKAVVDEAKARYSYGGTGSKPVAADDPNQFLADRYSVANPKTILIWTATPSAGPAPKYDIKGMIDSDVDLPKFGIHQGVSYLWLAPPNSTGARTLYIVHAKFPWSHKALKESPKFAGGHPGIHLVRASKTRIEGTKMVPEFAFGVCTDGCTSGHCGYQ